MRRSITKLVATPYRTSNRSQQKWQVRTIDTQTNAESFPKANVGLDAELQTVALQEGRYPTPPSVGSLSTTAPTNAKAKSSLYPHGGISNMPPCRICLSTDLPCCDPLPPDVRNPILALRDRNYPHLKGQGFYNSRGRSNFPRWRRIYPQGRWN